MNKGMWITIGVVAVVVISFLLLSNNNKQWDVNQLPSLNEEGSLDFIKQLNCKDEAKKLIAQQWLLYRDESEVIWKTFPLETFAQLDANDSEEGMTLGYYYNIAPRYTSLHRDLPLLKNNISKGRISFSFDIGLVPIGSITNVSVLKCGGNCNLKYEKDNYTHLQYQKFEQRYLDIEECKIYS